jgi:hypothetical protein
MKMEWLVKINLMLRNISAVVLEGSALAQLGQLSLLLGCPVREEVVANSVGVGKISVPLLNEGVSFEEVGKTHVELLNCSGRLVELGHVLHVFESVAVNGVGNCDEGEDDGLLHSLLLYSKKP